MAIRKFRKVMKPITIVIGIMFILSMVYGGWQSFRSTNANRKAQIAVKLNGKVLNKIDIERAKNELANQYSSILGHQIEKTLVDIIAFNQTIDKNLTLELAKKLKIKVPSSEVEKEYKQIENSIGDKEQFKRMLEFQGFSKESYKAKIEENLLLTKTIEAFSNEITPTEDEIKEYYDTVINNTNQDLESIKEEIINNIKSTKGIEKYSEVLNQARKEAKIENIALEYEPLIEKTLYEEEGFQISNLDFALETVSELMSGAKDKETAEKAAKEKITKQIKIAKVAQEKGVKVSENLNTLNKLAKYQFGLIAKFREEIKPTEQDLQVFFNENISKYAVKATADTNFAFITVRASKEDEELAKSKAEEVLKSVTVENFEKFGKSLSKEEGYLYEDLGTFTKGMMVKEFEDAVKGAETNSIVKNIVKTTFGYHIIFVKENNSKEEKWTVSHILVRIVPSAKTIEEKMVKLRKIKADIEAGTITFTDIQKLDEDIIQSVLIKGVTPEGLIPNLGYNPEITAEIFASNLNEVKFQKNGMNILMYQKVKEVKAEKADFAKSIDTVRNDYINYKAAESMRKLTF